MFKRIFFLLVFLIITFSSLASVYAQTTLYEEKSTSVVSEGVTRENIKRFTDEGWLNINILRIDLSDSHLNIDTIFSKDGSSVRNTVLQMANDSGAIAAVNGDFFSPKPGTNLAHSMSPLVQNGKLITTYDEEENKNTFGVFSLTKKGVPLYSFWSKTLSITAPNGKTMPIKSLNKFGWYEFLFMYDKSWGEKTPGKSDTFPTLTEMVVVNNKVKSFSFSSGPTTIPQDGYVISGDFAAGEFLKNNFKVGDAVKVSLRTTPYWQNLKMAIGGGAILVKNGLIPSVFSHDKPAVGPQTVVATTKDNKQMLLVTIDGRQVSSIGIAQPQLAKYMLSLGAYNALNLDGGGSTTMVTREPGQNDLQIVNDYCENVLRPVINGIGVFTSAPQGSLKGINIQTPDSNIFVNSSRSFSVSGYDNYFNPYNVDQSKVKWSFEGVSGRFKDNFFYPTSSGKGKITATIDGISSSIDINVLTSPVEIEVYPKAFTISDKPQWFGVRGYDKDGFSAFIHSNDVTLSNTSMVSISENYLRSKNNQSGLIKASFGNLYAYFSVASDKKLPPSKKTRDYQQAVFQPVTGNAYRISIYGTCDKLSALSLNNINSHSNFAGFAGTVSTQALSGITVPYSSNANGFSVTDYKDSKIISISAKGSKNDNSIRKKDSSQWTKLFDTLKNNTKNNVFILLDCPLSGDYGFYDGGELQLFKDTISAFVTATGKKVWVLYSDKKAEAKNENGVKYISIPNVRPQKYLSIVANGNNLTYKFVRIY